MGLYRLCLGRTTDGKTGYPLLIPMITNLLSFLDSALALKPQKTYSDVCNIINQRYVIGHFNLTCLFHFQIKNTIVVHFMSRQVFSEVLYLTIS